MYIELLEKKITDLQEETESMRKYVANSRGGGGDTFNKYATPSLRNLEGSRQQYLEKLKEVLAKNSENQIHKVLDDMKNLFGVNGTERLQIVNQLFVDLRDISIPESMRYVTECANDGTDMFSQHYLGISAFNQPKSNQQDMSNKLNLSPNQIKAIQMMRTEILTLKETINQKYVSMQKLKSDLQQMAISLYGTQDKFMNCLNPIQQAKLILAVEELLYMKNTVEEEQFRPMDSKLEANNDNRSVDSLNAINGRKFSDLVSHEDNWSLGKRGQRGYSSDFNFHTLFEFLENDPLLERLNDQM